MPFIIRIVGFEKFGIIGWVQVIMLYLSIFTDYGFNISATREIAINREDETQLSFIFSKVVTIKALLCLVAFLFLLLLIFFIPQFWNERITILLAFSMILGHSLLPLWFFQGVEKMFWLTLITFTSKIILAVLVIIVINQASDYIYFLFFLGIGNIVGGTVGMIIAIRRYKIQWKKVGVQDIQHELKDGWSIFISNISIASSKNSSLLILSFFAIDGKVIGYYNTAEKVIFAVWQILGIFSQAIYPHLCQLATRSHKLLRNFYTEIFIPFVVFVFLGCLLLFWQAKLIVWVLTGEEILEIVCLLQLMAIIPLIVILNIPFYQTLLVYNLKNQYAKVLFFSFWVNLVFGFVLIPLFLNIGVVITIIITQLFTTIGLLIMLEVYNKKLRILRITKK